MDISGIRFVLVIVSIYGTLAEDDVVQLTVSPSMITAKVGDMSSVLECTVNKKAEYLISNPVKWEKVGRDGSIMTISTLANVEKGLQDEFGMTLPPSDSNMVFQMKFLKGIKNDYDGIFRCVLYNKEGVLIKKAKAEVNVLKNFDTMTFSVGGTEQTVAGSSTIPIKLEQGSYESLCKTEGSNPGSTIKIYLDEVEQTAKQTDVKNTERTDPPQVFNSEKKVAVTLTPFHTKKILKCEAVVYNDDSMKGEMSFELDIYSVDPKFNCSNVTAMSGDKFVQLECTINLKGITCSDKIFWENGNNGEQFKLDNDNKDYKMFCENTSDGIVRTMFRITSVSQNDFIADYFVVYVNKHQSTKRQVATLNQDYSSATGSHSAVFLLCCSLLAATFL